MLYPSFCIGPLFMALVPSFLGHQLQEGIYDFVHDPQGLLSGRYVLSTVLRASQTSSSVFCVAHVSPGRRNDYLGQFTAGETEAQR